MTQKEADMTGYEKRRRDRMRGNENEWTREQDMTGHDKKRTKLDTDQ